MKHLTAAFGTVAVLAFAALAVWLSVDHLVPLLLWLVARALVLGPIQLAPSW